MSFHIYVLHYLALPLPVPQQARLQSNRGSIVMILWELVSQCLPKRSLIVSP